ncbi:MAG: (2Fe-2S) ferredoxin domain-containing protein [Legionellaceae bacterium]|nr:(2Fe-2S) ferredoxin domain-containing protein [Legionellaceae bacterium]
MHYQKHVFFCTNQKDPGKPCCANHQATQAVAYVKAQLKEKHATGPGKIRISPSGCLGRCRLGPCVVIYPEGVWYRYQDQADLDRIISEHLLQGTVVKSLLIDSPDAD